MIIVLIVLNMNVMEPSPGGTGGVVVPTKPGDGSAGLD